MIYNMPTLTLQHFAINCTNCGSRQVNLQFGQSFFRLQCPECMIVEQPITNPALDHLRKIAGLQEQATKMWGDMQQEGYDNKEATPKVREDAVQIEAESKPAPTKTALLMKQLIEEHDLDKLAKEKDNLSDWEYAYVKEQIEIILKQMKKQTVQK